MAKIGEADPRWIVSDRQDGQNVNAWHWTERDRTGWARARLEALCAGANLDQHGCISVRQEHTSSRCGCADPVLNFVNLLLCLFYWWSGAPPKLGKAFDHFDGTVLLFNRKGKSGIVYNVELRLPWVADFTDITAGPAAGLRGHGALVVHEISDEALEEGLEVEVTMADGTQAVYDAVKLAAQLGMTVLAAEFVSDLKRELAQELARTAPVSNAAAEGDTRDSVIEPVGITTCVGVSSSVVTELHDKQPTVTAEGPALEIYEPQLANRLACFSSLGGFLFGYDTGVV
eukprot:SAG31_NODE_2745_length_5147_cov_20.624604_2_plen_287_part_00